MKKKAKSKSSKGKTDPNPNQQAAILLKTYQEKCQERKQIPNASTVQDISRCISDDKKLTKLTFSREEAAHSIPLQACSVTTLINAILVSKCITICSLQLNNVSIEDGEFTDIRVLLQHMHYLILSLEITYCLISDDTVKRLANSLSKTNLKYLCLDHTRLGDGRCEVLCNGLMGNNKVTHFSLNYCDLQSSSGKFLGHLLMESVIRELHLDGNNLECDGFVDLITLAVDYMEMEMLKVENTESENCSVPIVNVLPSEAKRTRSTSPVKGKKKRGKKKSKVAPEVMKIGPFVEVLSLENNGIDTHANGNRHDPMTCMQLLGKWIKVSRCLKAININGNNIGSLASQEIIDALAERKQMSFKSVRITTSPCVETSLFKKILTLGSGKNKKKKGKKKKKK